MIHGLTRELGDYQLYYDDNTKRPLSMLDLLGEDSPPVPGGIPTYVPFHPPRAEERTRQDIEQIVLDLKIPIVQGVIEVPRPTLSLTENEMERSQKAVSLYAKATVYPKKVDWTAPKMKAHAYRPNYSLLGPEKYMLQLLAIQVNRGFGGAEKLLLDLTESMNEHYYGNGSFEGQFGRLLSVMRVSRKSKTARRKDTPWKRMTVDQRLDVLQKVMPLIKTEVPFIGNYLEVLRAGARDDKILSNVNATAADGLVYDPARRVEVPLQSVEMTDYILGEMDAIYKRHAWPQGQLDWSQAGSITQAMYDEVVDWLGKHRWVQLTEMKPKAEVYKRTDLHIKTRNITVYNSGVMAPAQAVMRATHVGMKNYLDDDGVLHILGFSPWKGGVDKLIWRMIAQSRKEGRVIGVAFADNLYFVDGDLWVSMDGEKMEACHTVAGGIEYGRHVLRNTTKMSPGWALYTAFLWPVISMKPILEYGLTQIPADQLGSGANGTAQFNTKEMIIVLVDLGNEASYNKDRFIHTAAENGIMLTEEIQTRIALVPGEIIKLDLLGMDAVYEPMISKKLLPILAYDRWLKSMSFAKADMSITGDDESMKLFKRLVKMRALYMLGGWYYPGAAELIRAICNHALEALGETMHLKHDEVVNAIGPMLGDDAEDLDLNAIASAANSQSLPTLYDVVKLLVGDDEAAEFTRQVLSGLYGDPLAVAPGLLPKERVKADDLLAYTDKVDRRVKEWFGTLDSSGEISLSAEEISIIEEGPTDVPQERGMVKHSLGSYYKNSRKVSPEVALAISKLQAIRAEHLMDMFKALPHPVVASQELTKYENTAIKDPRAKMASFIARQTSIPVHLVMRTVMSARAEPTFTDDPTKASLTVPFLRSFVPHIKNTKPRELTQKEEIFIAKPVSNAAPATRPLNQKGQKPLDSQARPSLIDEALVSFQQFEAQSGDEALVMKKHADLTKAEKKRLAEVREEQNRILAAESLAKEKAKLPKSKPVKEVVVKESASQREARIKAEKEAKKAAKSAGKKLVSQRPARGPLDQTPPPVASSSKPHVPASWEDAFD